jgi:hypothetical protein
MAKSSCADAQELRPGTFARLDHRELRLPTAVLCGRRDMLGDRFGVGELGFLDLGAAAGPVELPELTAVAHAPGGLQSRRPRTGL